MRRRETMEQGPKPPASRNNERGAVLVIVAVLLVVLIGFVTLVVDLGYFFVARNQLQNVSDASSLAGARVLGSIYQGIPYEQQQDLDCSDGTSCANQIRAAARDVALENRAGGVNITVPDGDILIGRWDGDNFTVNPDEPDAVQVLSRRDDVANGPLQTFFARVLGIESGNLTAIATAALSGQGTTAEGEVELPIGISSWFFDREDEDGYCNEDIQFYPTNDPASCAGWTSWEYNSNDATIRKILDTENTDYPSPETFAGETYYNFTGGTLSNPTFDELLTLFQIMGCDVDAEGKYFENPDGTCINLLPEGDSRAEPLMYVNNKGELVQAEYPDGTPRNSHKWETTLPVYDRGDCSNPNQSILIVGFAQIELTDVLNAPDKLVRGKVVCNRVDDDDSRGGGGNYGIKGSIPGLVR
jgi:Flp pilus assembly protein TadG